MNFLAPKWNNLNRYKKRYLDLKYRVFFWEQEIVVPITSSGGGVIILNPDYTQQQMAWSFSSNMGSKAGRFLWEADQHNLQTTQPVVPNADRPAPGILLK